MTSPFVIRLLLHMEKSLLTAPLFRYFSFFYIALALPSIAPLNNRNFIHHRLDQQCLSTNRLWRIQTVICSSLPNSFTLSVSARNVPLPSAEKSTQSPPAQFPCNRSNCPTNISTIVSTQFYCPIDHSECIVYFYRTPVFHPLISVTSRKSIDVFPLTNTSPPTR